MELITSIPYLLEALVGMGLYLTVGLILCIAIYVNTLPHERFGIPFIQILFIWLPLVAMYTYEILTEE